MSKYWKMTALMILLSLMCVSFLDACVSRSPESADKGVVYSNLVSQTAQDKLAALMTSAKISGARQQVLLDHVKQFNSIVNREGLVADFEVLKQDESNYDPYELQNAWNEKSPDFMGYNCRITAFGLIRDFVEIPVDAESREDMILMDLAALEEDPSVLLGADDKRAFSVLYSTVTTSCTKDISVHVENLQKDWNSRGIKFQEGSNARLISVVFHEYLDENENYLFIGHAGVLFMHDSKLYFLEKIAFQEPYQLIAFEDRAQLNEYLMGKYDVAFDQPTAAPFIMENDQLLEGYCTPGE